MTAASLDLFFILIMLVSSLVTILWSNYGLLSLTDIAQIVIEFAVSSSGEDGGGASDLTSAGRSFRMVRFVRLLRLVRVFSNDEVKAFLKKSKEVKLIR